MTMEADLNTLLKAICPRVFPDLAELGTPLPFVTWQGVGGESISFLDNTTGDKRNTLMQINAFSTTRMQALQIIRDVENAMRATPAFICKPMGEPVSTFEPDTKTYGAFQRFDIWSLR